MQKEVGITSKPVANKGETKGFQITLCTLEFSQILTGTFYKLLLLLRVQYCKSILAISKGVFTKLLWRAVG